MLYISTEGNNIETQHSSTISRQSHGKITAALEEEKWKHKEEPFPGCGEEFFIGEDEVLAVRGEILPEELDYVRKIKEKYGIQEEKSRVNNTLGLKHSCSDPSAYKKYKEQLVRLRSNQRNSPSAQHVKYFKEPRLAKYSSSSISSKQSASTNTEEKNDDYYEKFSSSASEVPVGGFLYSPSSAGLSGSTTTMESAKLECASDSLEYYSCQGKVHMQSRHLKPLN